MRKKQSLRYGCFISHKFQIVLKAVTIILFWLTLWQLLQISQVTNKLKTEPKQKDQTFIVIAFLFYASFATKRMKVDFYLDTHSAG